MDCRLLVDPPAAGVWNMAVDEMLLEWAAREEQPCLRFYQWCEPTLSLGYFQDHGERHEHAASADCPCVRRLTGGGAIVHDIELTYSLVLPARHRLAARRDELYDMVHGSLIEALAEFGVRACVAQASSLWRAEADGTGKMPVLREPFLCFQRRAASDVVVGETKIAGSAQRRRRGAVLQHGSVLLGRSTAALELAGLAELTGREFSAEDLTNVWLRKLTGALAPRLCPGTLTPEESRQAAALAENHYESAAWTENRGKRLPDGP